MTEGARSFYGGQAPTGGQGGEITAGRYDGPEAHVEAPWKCPACAQENEGPLKFGCVHCGSGKPGTHVGVQQPPPQRVQAKPTTEQPDSEVERAWQRFWEQLQIRSPTRAMQAEDLLREAFIVGYIAGAQGDSIREQAPPVTADVDVLAPAGKPRRTIVAALEIFRDQILPVSEEEIASGEWCSVTEIDTLIVQLKGGEEEEG